MLFLLNIATPDIVFDFLHRFPHMATKTDDVLKSNALIRITNISESPRFSSNNIVSVIKTQSHDSRQFLDYRQ